MGGNYPEVSVGLISWDGMRDAAQSIAAAVSREVDELVVVFSNERGEREIGEGLWIGVPQSDYFGRKFSTLLESVAPENALLLIQADASCSDWPALVRRYREVSRNKTEVGLWSPDIDNSPFPNAVVGTGDTGDGLIDVLQTDSVVLGLTSDVVRHLSELKYDQNNLGWGIDWAAIGYCLCEGLRITRDLAVRITHPTSRGYDSAEAQKQMEDFLRQLPAAETDAIGAAERLVRLNTLRRAGNVHPAPTLLAAKGRNSPDQDDGFPSMYQDQFSFVMVEPGRVVLAPKSPDTKVSLLQGGEVIAPLADADQTNVARILDFSDQIQPGGRASLVTGQKWSCRGQSTCRFTFPRDQGAIRQDLIKPVELTDADGDLHLKFGCASHRANIDVLVEWGETGDRDDTCESWVKISPEFRGESGWSDYQGISVRIPRTERTRQLRVTLLYWGGDPGVQDEPPLALCTRPYLVSDADGLSKTDALMVIADPDPDQDPRLLEFRIEPGTRELATVVNAQHYLLIPGPEGGANLKLLPDALEAWTDSPGPFVLFGNGWAMQRLWLSPEPQRISLDGDIFGIPGMILELRDPTGNVIHDRCRLPESTSNPGKAKRHPEAGLIEDVMDQSFYLAGFAQGEQPEDPASHYLSEGWAEGRDPAPWFSAWHYLAMHVDVAKSGMNPFLHYCIAGRREGRQLAALGKHSGGDVYAAQALAVEPGPSFEEFDPSIGVSRNRRAKVLAYYLPQYHASPTNDANWGTGFTEWRNLPRAMPRYNGHIQPRIPRDLGPYDLAESDVMRRQIEMARTAGLHGFCFYHYWFDGKRVLDTPVNRFLDDPSLDFPFCLMWTNENWTRAWDGSDKEVILAQNYLDTDDIPLIDDLARHMNDSRYIRIDGRPLFFIYRPGQIPEAKATIEKWRRLLQSRHNLSPLVMMAQGFGDLDPRVYGLDGAIEFPPHKLYQDLPPINADIDLLDPDYAGHIVSYDAAIERSIAAPASDFPLIRTATPNWDNDARRPGRGMILHGSTPEKFEAWVDELVSYANANPVHGERFVAINAWNEWAEGAVLEPDVHYGAAYLNALSRAVHGATGKVRADKTKVLIVGHDANMNGAQLLALNIGETLTSRFGVGVAYVLGEGGPLLERYRAIGHVEIAPSSEEDRVALFEKLAQKGFDHAIANTTPSGQFLPALKSAGIKTLSLIHELPNLMKSYDLEEAAQQIARHSDHVVFPAEVVRQRFESFAGDIANEVVERPQGLYNSAVLDTASGDHGVRTELNLGPETKIVLGVGYADLRKGIDRFVSTGLSLCSHHEDIAFVWVGNTAGEVGDWIMPEIEASNFRDRVRILGHREDVGRFYAAADAFYLPSREDPFPSVVLEAMASGLPVIGHQGCGGCDELIEKHGYLIARNDTAAMSETILSAINSDNKRAANARKTEVRNTYDFPGYVFDLLKHLLPETASVSAVVPNYNYEPFVGERLRTVFDQIAPLREVIVLDDASTDGSVAEIERTAEAAHRQIKLHVNKKNGGSPFSQWRKGVELALGEYVWIAEADDLAHPTFVAHLVGQMQLAGSILGFTDSRQIDETGALIGDSYRGYVNDIEAGVFDKPFDMDGPEFLARFLAVKNVILNVSGVIFRRDALLDAIDAVGDDLDQFGVAGDWCLYSELLAQKGSRVSYLAEPLNTHRRHAVSVTHTLEVEKHLHEISEMHRQVARKVPVSPSTAKKQEENLAACKAHLEA